MKTAIDIRKEKVKKHLTKNSPWITNIDKAIEENFNCFEYLGQPAKIADAISTIAQ